MESEPGQPHIRLPFAFRSHLCDHAAHHRKQYILCSSFTSTSWGPKLSRNEVDERWGSGSSSTVSSISALHLCIQHQSSASAAAGFATAGFCGSSSPLAAGMAHLLPNLGLRHVVTPKWVSTRCSGLAAKCAQPALAQTIPPDAVPFRQHLDTKDVSHQCHIRTAMRAWRCHLPARPTARSSIVSGISSYGRPMNELFQLHGGQSSLAMRWTKGGAGMPFHRGMQRQPKGAPASHHQKHKFSDAKLIRVKISERNTVGGHRRSWILAAEQGFKLDNPSDQRSVLSLDRTELSTAFFGEVRQRTIFGATCPSLRIIRFPLETRGSRLKAPSSGATS